MKKKPYNGYTFYKRLIELSDCFIRGFNNGLVEGTEPFVKIVQEKED